MAFVKFESGVKLVWDETISVGELILTYYSGYFILERIEFADAPKGSSCKAVEWSDKEAYPYPPSFHLVKVLKDDGTPSKAIRKSCCAYYCSRVTKDEVQALLCKEIDAANVKFSAISSFL